MKLIAMKLTCLLVVLGSIFGIGLIFNLAPAWQAYDQMLSYYPKGPDGTQNLQLLAAIIGGILIVLAGYGFLPRLRGRKNKTISYRGTHGDIVIELKPIRKVLLRVMRKMPEVYAIKLDVRPDADGRKACILADVVLKNSAALGARRCAKMVADCLAATAKDVLGLEDLSMVRINVKGVHVDIAATGRQMREQLESRAEEESAAYALAHPPVASVTMDVHSTDNRSAGIGDVNSGEEPSFSENNEGADESCTCPVEEDSTNQSPPPCMMDAVDEDTNGDTTCPGTETCHISVNTEKPSVKGEEFVLPPLSEPADEIPPLTESETDESYDSGHAAEEADLLEETDEVPEAQAIDDDPGTAEKSDSCDGPDKPKRRWF